MAEAPALRLARDVLAATAGAHSARVLGRAIARALAGHLPVVRVVLEASGTVVELVDGEWRPREHVTGPVTPFAPGLAIATRGALPSFARDPDLRALVGHVVDTATRHLAVVQRVALLSRRAHVDNRALRSDLERLEDSGEIVARSPAMRSVLSRAALVARHDTTVLLVGESGTGKEVLAREIHRRSPRAHRPMLHVNCGAIPESLVESELFGHERGAFTGADRAHAGLFERGHRGTLLLDEVGELPLAAQAKLLRVLQERTLRRVGGSTEIAIDVRLIAATHRRLADMVAQGTFREDLYYRLDVFAIEIPPLRARRADLAPLVALLTSQLATKLDLPRPAVPRAVLARLEAHDWPGNVRELANVLEAAMIVGGTSALALPEGVPRRTARRDATNAPGPRLDAAVRDAIEACLRETRGKIYGVDGAAARLGLPPATLQSKMKKLGIARSRFL